MIIIVLVLMALAVMPNLPAMKAAQEYRDFRISLRRLASEARVGAVTSGSTVALLYDESGRQLQVASVGAEGEVARTRSSLRLPDGVEPVSFSTGLDLDTASTWRLEFFSDGRTAGGGIEFQGRGESFSLTIDESGRSELVGGGLPDPSTLKWQAGDLEQRL